MTRFAILFGLVALYAGAVVVFLSGPARSDEPKPLPYTCLPAPGADEIHRLRGDTLIARRQQGRYIEFAWRALDGEWLIVRFDRGTLLACAVRWTPHDPRQDRSS
jgi:hypothetical protein